MHRQDLRPSDREGHRLQTFTDTAKTTQQIHFTAFISGQPVKPALIHSFIFVY